MRARFANCVRSAVAGILCLAAGGVLIVPTNARGQGAGSVDPVFGGTSLGLEGNVKTVALQADGKVLVAGTFPRHLARLNANGAVDTSFNPIVDQPAAALAVQSDGRILVGGEFYAVDGANRDSIARLNADGSLDTSFNPGVQFYQFVDTLAMQSDGKIVVGGQSHGANGVNNAGYLARLNADGTPDASFNSTADGHEVRAAAVQSDGKILVGGDFTEINGSSHSGIARLNADGTVDGSFNAGVDKEIFTLVLQSDGKILVGGDFFQINGVYQNGFARLNADGTVDTGFQATTTGYGVVATVLQPDGKILIGGYNTEYSGNNLFTLARLNADGTVDSSFSANADNEVVALALQPDGKVVVGGLFAKINGVAANSVSRLDADGSTDGGFVADVASGPNNPVSSLVAQPDGKLLILGSFTQVGTASEPGFARLNADGTVDTGFAPSFDGTVEAVALQPDGKVLVGGVFTTVDGGEQARLVRLDADGSPDGGFTPDINNAVSVLALQSDGKVIIAGQFNEISGVDQNTLARLNADGSLDGGFRPNLAHPIYSTTDIVLAVQPDDKVLVGGYFYDANNSFQNYLVRFNADGSPDNGFGVNLNYPAAALALQPDGKILIGGGFTSVNGAGKMYLARLNADGSLDSGFAPSIGYTVDSLALQLDGKIVVGGGFAQVDGASVNHLARLNADGSLDPFFNPGGSGPDQPVDALAIQTDGKIFVGGSFTSINGVLRNFVARLNGGGAPDFFNWGVPVGGGFYYEQFPDGVPFGYYNLAGQGYSFPYFFHTDLGMEYFFDANDGQGGAYLFDFASGGFFYTSPVFPFPYLYDFTLNTVLYYYPDPNNAGHYNTNGYRFFYRFDTGQVIVK